MTQGDGGSYEDVPACMAIPWTYSVGFSITFGTLFAKIRRVCLIFKSAAELRRREVTFRETASVTACVLLLDIVILLVWSIVDSLRWERTVLRTDKFGEALESEGHCTSDHWEWWIGTITLLHLALLGIACFMCYVSRDIPTKFSEGKYVSIAMFSNLQIFVVGVPILIILGSDPEASFFVRTVVIWMNDFVVVTLIFGNLIYHVHFSTQKTDGKKAVNQAIQSAISKFSEGHNERRNSRVQRLSYVSDSRFSTRFDPEAMPDLPEEESKDFRSSSFTPGNARTSWTGLETSHSRGSSSGGDPESRHSRPSLKESSHPSSRESSRQEDDRVELPNSQVDLDVPNQTSHETRASSETYKTVDSSNSEGDPCPPNSAAGKGDTAALSAADSWIVNSEVGDRDEQ